MRCLFDNGESSAYISITTPNCQHRSLVTSRVEVLFDDSLVYKFDNMLLGIGSLS